MPHHAQPDISLIVSLELEIYHLISNVQGDSEACLMKLCKFPLTTELLQSDFHGSS